MLGSGDGKPAHSLLATQVVPVLVDGQRALSSRVAAILADGLPDRSRGEWSVIWGMIQSRWTPQQAMATLLMPEYAAGEKLRQINAKSPTAAWRRFEKQWAKAQQRIALSPARDDPYEVHVAIADLTAFAEEHSHMWSGPKVLDRLALGYLLSVATRTELLTVKCSSRMLAAHLNCRQGTATDVLRRLSRGPLLHLVRQSQGRMAPSYRLTDAWPIECTVCSTDSVVRTPGGEASTESVLHTSAEAVSDAFLPAQAGRSSLGCTPALVWLTMPEQPVTRADLMLNLGKHRTTIQRSLDRLHAAGLIAPAGDGWVKTNATPDEVAQVLGIPKVRERRIEHFRNETTKFQEGLADKARQRYRDRRSRHIWHLSQQGRPVPLQDLLPTQAIPSADPLGCGPVGRVTLWFWKDGRYQVRDGSRVDDRPRSR